MKGLKLFDRRIGFSLAAVSMLLGMVVPAVVPAFASAYNIATDRSIAMSSTSPEGAPGGGATTTYNVTFTPQSTGTQYLLLLFCSNSPIITDSCSPPSSMSLTSASIDTAHSSDGSATITGTTGANSIIIDTTTTTSAYNVVLKDVQNPSTVGTFYGRIETFASSADATAAQTTPSDTTGLNDAGGVALSITSQIGINATVEESMTFCVAGYNSDTAPNAECDASSGSLASPAVNLGTQQGSTNYYILGNTASTATDFAQMSTNASSGATVYLKSDSTGCGGLYFITNGTTKECGIKPASTSGQALANGAGEFGLTVGASALESGDSSATGLLCPATGYDGTHPYINYAVGDATGVTSTYGGALLNSGSGASCSSGFTQGPISDVNVPVTFSANAAPNTPAGQYSANLSMIAVGTF